MAIVRWSPARELMPALSEEMFDMRRQINRMFDNLFRGEVPESADLPSIWNPSVDIAERESEYVVKVELPGVSKDDVRITLEDALLTIRGEKKQEKESKEANYHRMERSYGSFQRSFTLPASVKADKIEASYRDGILTVTLPKADEARRKQIEVKVK
jgi:HSP20 family protein